MSKIFPLLLVAFVSLSKFSYSQFSLPLRTLKHQLQQSSPTSYDSSELYFKLFTKEGLIYLNPVYQLLLNSEKMKAGMGEEGFYDNASQWISFTGDYKTSNALAETERDTLTLRSIKHIEQVITSYKGSRHVDAKQYILNKAHNFRIIMINEAHHNPSHRAFTFSLLDDLYKQGYRYFAMETFNNRPVHVLDRVSGVLTGTYTCEPIGGELVRHALKLGYKLISYEDTVYKAGRTSTQRDSAQANHLYQVFQKDSTAKILIHAGYGHISRKSTDEYIPLGAALYSLSNIPYLSIDQIAYSEGSYYVNERTRYNYYLKKYPVERPAIALRKNDEVNLFDTSLYDLNVIHPKTKYEDERPDWAALNGYRKKYVIGRSLISSKTFFVQAYYQKEILNNKMENLVPADQTYCKTSRGEYVLYLQKDNYTLIFRDAFYNVIRTVKVKVI